MRSFRLLPLAFMLALSIPACSSSDSGDDDSAGNQTGSEHPGKTSADITAADGGDVELGAAKLSIPGGALSDDTTVTVESKQPSSDLPDASSVQGLVYDLGPTGTTFSKPVALTLPAKAPGTGKEAVIAYLDESTNSWTDLTTTTGKDGTVSADIMHFSTYTVLIRNTNVDTGSDEVDCSFSACGGNPVGTWQVASACITGDSSDNPFGDSCPDASIGIDIAADGTLDVTKDRYTWNLSLSGNAVITVPPDCIQTLGMGQITDCSSFAGDDDGTVCTGSIEKGCSCTSPIDPTTENSTGSYVVDGNTIIGTNDDETEPGSPSEFCVKGNQLKLKINNDDDDSTQTQVLVFQK